MSASTNRFVLIGLSALSIKEDVQVQSSLGSSLIYLEVSHSSFSLRHGSMLPQIFLGATLTIPYISSASKLQSSF